MVAPPFPAAPPKRRVFIVDDHPVFVQGIRQLIEGELDLEVCGFAVSGPEALTAIDQLMPDLVILDISIQGSNGIELMKSVKALHPRLPVLFLSMHDETLYAERALRAGARGYVMKSSPGAKVVEAVRKVLAGGLYLSDSLGTRFLDSFLTGRAKTGASPVENLTDRELEIYTAIGQGRGTRQIALDLNLSIKTVETHRAHIKEKLRFTSALEMVRAAVEWVNGEAGGWGIAEQVSRCGLKGSRINRATLRKGSSFNTQAWLLISRSSRDPSLSG